ncbi:hypothetical protein GGD66_008160 [Bradyrhizobium sp. CIR48]|nr:hypothetical protein [Bradyrhizobium sp. CIR18]MBB4429556.1 hypothetical protein [Bradyrhizobium sp. CIR48]
MSWTPGSTPFILNPQTEYNPDNDHAGPFPG